MSALIAILVQVLPLILRLFGLGAVAAASVSYTRITAADPDVALTAASMVNYVGSWGGAAAGSFGLAGLLNRYLRNRVKGFGDFIEIIREIIQFLNDNPDAFDFIKKLLELFKLQGVDVSQVESAIERFRPTGGTK